MGPDECEARCGQRGTETGGWARDNAASAARGAGLGTDRSASSRGLSAASAACALRESIRPSDPIPCTFAAPPLVLARHTPPRLLLKRCEVDFRQSDFRLANKRRNGKRRRSARGAQRGGRLALLGSRVHARVALLVGLPPPPRIPLSPLLDGTVAEGKFSLGHPSTLSEGSEANFRSAGRGRALARPSPDPFLRFAGAKPKGCAPQTLRTAMRCLRTAELGRVPAYAC